MINNTTEKFTINAGIIATMGTISEARYRVIRTEWTLSPPRKIFQVTFLRNLLRKDIQARYTKPVLGPVVNAVWANGQRHDRVHLDEGETEIQNPEGVASPWREAIAEDYSYSAQQKMQNRAAVVDKHTRQWIS